MAGSREEALLQSILGEEAEIEAAKSRIEKIWQYALGIDGVELEPAKSRIETLAIQVAEQVRSGGGIQDRTIENGIIDKSLSGDYVNDDVTEIGLYTFVGCRSLETVSFKKATIIGQNSFGSGAAASALIALTAAHFPVAEEIETAAFRKASSLEALIMDQITEVPTLANTNAFQDTPIAAGTGYIYVPDALVDQVKIATNLSTFAAQIKGMSDCPQTYKTKFGIS